VGKIEPPDDWRSGNDNNRSLVKCLHQLVSNGAAAPQMTKAKSIMTVNQNTLAMPLFNWRHLVTRSGICAIGTKSPQAHKCMTNNCFKWWRPVRAADTTLIS